MRDAMRRLHSGMPYDLRPRTSVTLSRLTISRLRAEGGVRETLEAALLIAAALGDFDAQLRAAALRPIKIPKDPRGITALRISDALEGVRFAVVRRIGNFSAWAEVAVAEYVEVGGTVARDFTPAERSALEARVAARYPKPRRSQRGALR